MSGNASPYAKNVLARGPEVAARELDRLQRKLALYQRALERIEMSESGTVARDTLREGKEF